MKNRIGIFGGTFDPPHFGHLNMARAAYEKMQLDEVWFLPNKIPAYKLKKHGISSETDRLYMLKMLLENESEWCDIKLFELEREGNTYTSDTLLFLNREFKDTDFYLIIGSDSYKEMKNWHEPEIVFENAKIVVLLRNEDVTEDINKISKWYKDTYNANVYLLDNVKIDISSTEIRNSIKNNNKTHEMIPDRIYEYIIENNMYFDL